MGLKPEGDGAPTQDAVHISLPAVHRYLNVLQATIAALLEQADEAADGQKLAHIQLAAQEICANIVNHAYGGGGLDKRIDIAIGTSADPLTIILEIQDRGIGFNPEAVPVPQMGAVQAGGYGLFLTRQAADHVVYQAPAGRAWQSRANKPWEAAGASISSLFFPTIPADVNFWRLVKQL